MPTQKNFKKLVRGRMAKTGESYTAARARLSPPASSVETDPDARTLARLLEAAGVVNPLTDRAYGPELLFGIGGGIGFAYLVFEYPGVTTVHVDGRFNGLYFEKTGFFETACARLGVPLRVWPTADAAVTEKRLRQALATTPEVGLTLDLVRLPGADALSDLPYAPRTVTVSSADDGLLVKGLARGATTMELSTVVEARWTGNKKYGGLFVCGQPSSPPDLSDVVRRSVDRTMECLLSPDRSNFDGSFGVAGLRRWARLLVDGRDKKGWPRLFRDRAALDAALVPVVRGLGDSAARWPYAAFLDDVGLPAEEHRRLGDRWAALIDTVRRPGVTPGEIAEALPDLADAEEAAAASLR